MCRKRGAVSLGSASRRRMGWEGVGGVRWGRCSAGWGDAWSSALGSPPPLWAVAKSSLKGSLAVSFTLNIKVRQKESGLSVGRRGPGESLLWRQGGWAQDPRPPTPPSGTQVQGDPGGGARSPATQTARCKTPTPRPPTCASCPILSSRLKIK